MKKINFDPQLFINEFNCKIEFTDIKVPKDTLTHIVKIAKNKFSHKNNKEVTFSLDCFKYKEKIYKQFCRIIPNTGELGYEVRESRTGKTVFSFLYSGVPLPDHISSIIDVRQYVIETTAIKDYTLLYKALATAYSKGFSSLTIGNKKTFFIYESDILTFKNSKKVINTFYIPDEVFELGLYPTLFKYKNIILDDYDIAPTALKDIETFNIENLNGFIKYVKGRLNLSRNEFIHVAAMLLHNRNYDYKHYRFSVDGLFLPALVIEAIAPNAEIKLMRFILNDSAFNDLLSAVFDFHKEDSKGLDAFQLAKELTSLLSLPSDKIFQIFSDITLATVEKEINLIDNYTLYIYAKEGKAMLYNGKYLIEKFSINKKAFNGIRIDYYHYLSNF